MVKKQILKNNINQSILIYSQVIFLKSFLSIWIGEKKGATLLAPHVEEDTSWRGMNVQKEYTEGALPFIYNAPCLTVHHLFHIRGQELKRKL